jgi:prepilin-type N-terminal cleavage/methylation domain-containing protein
LAAFTLLELLIVISVIAVLAGLVLTTSSYVAKEGARARAQAELAALSTALENYKADNGIYPHDGRTAALDPTTSTDPGNYVAAGHLLYRQLSGDIDNHRGTGADNKKNYIAALLKPSSLATPPNETPYLKDPWGNAYGYSTSKAEGGNGYNPTFDLWSTAASIDRKQWIRNW